MNVVVVVQARSASSRLPGKVLLPAAGEPLLAHMLRRVRAARRVERLFVATTHDPQDDAIVALCRELAVECYRGDPLDCLDRHYQIGLATFADAVVKIPSDCPLIDPAVIDRVLDTHAALGPEYDFVSNLHPGSWPDGNDVEVISMRALSSAAREATTEFDREHTTPFIWSRPARFLMHNVRWETGLDYSQSQRWVIDWPEDYVLVREVIESLVPSHGPLFDLQSILQLLQARPALACHNAKHRGYSYWAAARRPTETLSSTDAALATRAAKENPA